MRNVFRCHNDHYGFAASLVTFDHPNSPSTSPPAFKSTLQQSAVCPSSSGAGVSPPARPAVPALRMSGAHVPPCFVSQAERVPAGPPVWRAHDHVRLRARDEGTHGADIALRGALLRPRVPSCAALSLRRARFRQSRLAGSSPCVSHAHAMRPTASLHLSPHLLPVPRLLRRCMTDAHFG